MDSVRNEALHAFCDVFKIANHSKAEQAAALIWFQCRFFEYAEINTNEICNLFLSANLPRPNLSRLIQDLKRDRKVHSGSKPGMLCPSREFAKNMDNEFGHLFTKVITVHERANIEKTPLLTEREVNSARTMAELYVVLHCYENSVRRLVEKTLDQSFGPNWWEVSANAAMKKKVEERKLKEAKQKWITPRGSSATFYIDWGDLVVLIRKYETIFAPVIHDLKFVELRLEELERIRNIVAHNGSLPSTDDFDRVILSFRDWCKQVS